MAHSVLLESKPENPQTGAKGIGPSIPLNAVYRISRPRGGCVGRGICGDCVFKSRYHGHRGAGQGTRVGTPLGPRTEGGTNPDAYVAAEVTTPSRRLTLERRLADARFTTIGLL